MKIRKGIVTVIMLLFIMLGTRVNAASGPDIQAVVNGKIDKGENIQILINIKDIKSLYAGDIEYKYDTSVLKVKSLEIGDLISKTGINKFDAINKIDDKAGIVRYAFSCLGQINGFAGTGTVIKINAEVLKKDDNFHINSKPFLKEVSTENNLKMQICDKDIKELEYNFTPYAVTGTITPPAANNDTGNINTGNAAAGTNNTNAGNASTSDAAAAENKSESVFQVIEDKVLSIFGIDNKAKQQANSVKQSNTDQSAAMQNQDNSNTNKQDVNSASEDSSQKSQVNNSQASSEANKEQGNGTQKNNKTAAVILTLIILLGGGGGYFVWRKKQNKAADNY